MLPLCSAMQRVWFGARASAPCLNVAGQQDMAVLRAATGAQACTCGWPPRHALWTKAEQPDETSTNVRQPLRWSLAKPRAKAPLFADVQTSDGLTSKHVGQYYPVEEQRIPEAFEAWYADRGAKPGKAIPIDGGGRVHPLPRFVSGCTGLQYELAQSQYPYVLYRDSFAALWDLVMGTGRRKQQRLLLRGPVGSGKSVLMAATAERLRKENWIVMHIPDCLDITHKNMFYSKNEETGMFDTRDTAQHILRSMLEVHGDQLRELPQQVPDGNGTLYDLCNQPEAATDDCAHGFDRTPHIPLPCPWRYVNGMAGLQASLCSAVVRMKLELYRLPASVPSAVILDGYNALFWQSELFDLPEWEGRPRRIDAQELTLGANLRALSDANVGHTTVLAAVSAGGRIPDLPTALMAREDAPPRPFTVPLLSLDELGTMLLYYRFVHAMAPTQLVTESGVKAAHQLTQGDGKAVRRQLHFLLPYDPSLADMDAVGEAYSDVDLFATVAKL